MKDETAWAGRPGAIEPPSRRAARVGGVRAADAALLVLAVAFAVLACVFFVARIAAGDERRDADRRLAAVSDAAADAFADAVADLELLTRTRATDANVVGALARGDRRALRRIAAVDGLSFLKRGRVIAGQPPAGDDPVRRTADVVEGGRVLGTVVGVLRFDEALVRRLERAARVRRPEQLALVVRGTIVAGAPSGRVDAAGTSDTIVIAGRRYRAVSTELLDDRPDVLVAALVPRAVVDEAAADQRNRVLLALLATIAAVMLAATALVLWRRQRRVAVRIRAVEHERRTVREALSLVGDALASTHDTEALLPVIVHTALEAAGATGARLLRDDQDVMRAGRPSASKTPLVLPLGVDDDGRELRLLLYAPGAGPLPEARELAEWFVSQAAIALENARLHGIVKRQAITDPLTGLANRRRFVEALEAELSRAERFDTDLAVVIADLDDFKNVNDSFGHEVGNDVLRAFANLVGETLRDVDVAARLGGEEFAMLLPQTDLEGGMTLAERIRGSFAATPIMTPDGRKLYVTGSFGVASYPPTGTVDGLLRAADGALYRAKAAGKNRVELA